MIGKAGRLILGGMLCGGMVLTMVTASAYLYLSPKLPPAESYRDIRLENPLRIFTEDGKLIAEFGNKRRNPIKLEEVPPLLIDALIASEDSRFYSHNGVDLRALARSVIGILSGNPSGGGSTLTMQVAKNISFEGEDPYSRKFKEILLALQIERELSKEEILELYLNRIFFGISAYGIAAASEQFYNKQPSELTLPEMAMLIAQLPAPNAYNPLSSPERAMTYRSRVLRRMHEQGMIDRIQYEEANQAPLTAQRFGRQPEIEAGYIAEMVRIEMENRYGELALTDGFEVYTSINSDMQLAANHALRSGLENYDRNHGYRGPESRLPPRNDGDTGHWLEVLARTPRIAGQEPAFVVNVGENSLTVLRANGETANIYWEGIRWAKRFINSNAWGSTPRSASEVAAVGDLVRIRFAPESGEWALGQIPDTNGGLVSLDASNGAIRALAGGYDFRHSNFNRITQARRQPGSSFKPFLYAAALDNGYTAASMINDAPLARSDYRPENFNRQFTGPIRLKQALTESKNLVSIRLYDALGSQNVLSYIERFGFNPAEFPQNDLTVAIGSHAVTPLEIAVGYTVFANGGYKVEPYFIERINNFNDGEVYRARPYRVCRDCEQTALAEQDAGEAAALDDFLSPLEPAQPFSPEVAAAVSGKFIPAPRVLDEGVAYIMNTMLRSVVTSGSGRGVSRNIPRSDLAGKTGTTNDNFDLWFAGYNGDLVTTVFVGFDQPATLGRMEQAATVAVPIWTEYTQKALHGKPESFMAQPDGLVTVRINPDTGLRAAPGESGAIFEVFRERYLPGAPDNSGTQSSTGSLRQEPIF